MSVQYIGFQNGQQYTGFTWSLESAWSWPRGRRARNPFSRVSLIGSRPIFLVQGRVSLARTSRLPVNIAVTFYGRCAAPPTLCLGFIR